MKLTTDVYLLPSLRVHLHFPVWHNCHGKNHRDSSTFALCLGFSSSFCPLLCFHAYSLFITLFCVQHLPLNGLSTSAIEVASSSLYPHKWPSPLTMHRVLSSVSLPSLYRACCLWSKANLSLTSLVLKLWKGHFVHGLFCVLVHFIIIWFLFLQIPFYPVVKKDLTFINLGNDSKIEGLINFEKLRMIAKEVRALTNMCSSPYDLLTMLGLGERHIFLFYCMVSQLQQIG